MAVYLKGGLILIVRVAAVSEEEEEEAAAAAAAAAAGAGAAGVGVGGCWGPCNGRLLGQRVKSLSFSCYRGCTL